MNVLYRSNFIQLTLATKQRLPITSATSGQRVDASQEVVPEVVMVAHGPSEDGNDEALRSALALTLQNDPQKLAEVSFGSTGPPKDEWTGDHDNPHACFFCRQAPRIGNEPAPFQCMICKRCMIRATGQVFR